MRSIRPAVVAVSATLSLALLGACSGGSSGGSTAATEAQVVSYHAAYPSYSSPADLLDTANLVVRGVPQSSHTKQGFMDVSDDSDPNTNPQAGLSSDKVEEARQDSAIVVTVSTVRVDEVIKGDAKVGDTIEVSQLGGSLDGTKYNDPETTLLSKDSPYVLFLAEHKNAPYDLLNPEQGMYTASSDGQLAPVSKDNSLEIGSVRTLKNAAKAAK